MLSDFTLSERGWSEKQNPPPEEHHNAAKDTTKAKSWFPRFNVST